MEIKRIERGYCSVCGNKSEGSTEILKNRKGKKP